MAWMREGEREGCGRLVPIARGEGAKIEERNDVVEHTLPFGAREGVKHVFGRSMELNTTTHLAEISEE